MLPTSPPPPPSLILATLVWLARFIGVSLAWLSLIGLVVAALGLEYIGQHNLFTAFLLYLPAWIWALPLACLIPFLLFLSPRLGLGSLTLVLLYWGPWLGFGFSPVPPSAPVPMSMPVPGEIRLLSWNRGQSGGESLQPFKNKVQPNLMAFQDAARRLAGYQKAPEYSDLPHAAQEGEFLLLSAFPIRSSKLLHFHPDPHPHLHPHTEAPQSKSHGTAGVGAVAGAVAVAARFEVEGPAGAFALYNVHLPTPRDTLSFYRRGVFVLGLIGLPGTEWGRKREVYQAYWDGLLALNHQLAESIAADDLPVLVAGDFNSPALGPAHRSFTRFLSDSHREGGSGYGYTFPGTTGNPLALFRPWLRLDRILASDSWQLTGQETETGRASQHLAVFAAYREEGKKGEVKAEN